MNRISAFRLKHAHAVALIGLTFWVAAVHAQAPARPNRPAGVPDGYVITPFGYFHPSCIQHVANGDTVLAEKRAIRHGDGTYENIQNCNYPRYGANGKVIVNGAEETVPAPNHTYVEDAVLGIGTHINFGSIVANWIVPPKPITNHGQTIYLFPGFATTASVQTGLTSILQPVLGWNADTAYPGVWDIASWWCCLTGYVWEGPPVKVNVGDTIFGKVVSTCSAGTEACPSWDIYTKDVTSGLATSLVISLPLDQQGYPPLMYAAYAGTLEEWNVVACTDYPSNGSITFSNIVLDDYNFNQISSPGWTYIMDSSLRPNCSFAAGQFAGSQVTLKWMRQAPYAALNNLLLH